MESSFQETRFFFLKKIIFQHTLGPSTLVASLNLRQDGYLAGYQVGIPLIFREAARVDAFRANGCARGRIPQPGRMNGYIYIRP